MIHLLQPLWLWAMAAIAAPVILHFWNDRRGKVLPVGSVFLLKEASQRMAWSRRLSQWWLLLLRFLLLVLLAILLAGPYWRQTGKGSRVKGWVLAETGGDAMWGVTIDSLIKAGWERHILSDSQNYWNGFRAADSTAPAGAPFFMVTTGLAARFSGERPSTDREVNWYTYTPNDSVRHWIQSAWLGVGDSIQVLSGMSRSSGSVYTSESVAPGSQLPVRVDTSTLRVVVVADPVYRQDGLYVGAALRALQQYTRRRMEMTDRTPGAADWLFWLSVRPVPAGDFAHVSRFDPNWNELAWNGALPVMISTLLFGEDTDVVGDRRVIDPAQMAPVHRAGAGRVAQLPGGKIDLTPVVWWLILLLFIAERVASHGKRKT